MRGRRGNTKTGVTFRTGNGRKRRWGYEKGGERMTRKGRSGERTKRRVRIEEWGKTQMRDGRMRDEGYASEIVARSWIRAERRWGEDGKEVSGCVRRREEGWRVRG